MEYSEVSHLSQQAKCLQVAGTVVMYRGDPRPPQPPGARTIRS